MGGAMGRHELDDEHWKHIEGMFGRAHGRGRRCRDLRRVVNGLLWLVRTGAAWRDLPERYGPWQTLYYHFSRWRDAGIWDKVAKHLQAQLTTVGVLDTDLWCIDGSNVRAAKAAAGCLKRGVRLPNRPTMHWVDPEEVGARNSTWSLTVAGSR